MGILNSKLLTGNSNIDYSICPLCEGSKTRKGSWLLKCPKCKGTGKRIKNYGK